MAGKAKKGYTEDFNQFWKKYPARWNSNLSCYVKRKKYPAFLSWCKLSTEIKAECLAKAKYIKASEGTPRDCVTWLNQRGWEDIEIDVPIPIVTKEQADRLFKQVPQGDNRSVSNRVNEQRNKLSGNKECGTKR